MTLNIKIVDDQKPEDVAMLQALYSRSPASVDSHLKKVAASGAGSFMDRYYIGYGHASIGDCGTTTIFIEGVTMLAAKAIQDWALYSGQESSTRYMDFSNAVFANPLGTAAGEIVQERWRTFYLEAREPVARHLRQRYPIQDGEDPKVYERAIDARTFDTLRCFLPAGATTNLSWHTNLRQAQDHLRGLIAHPDPSIAEIGKTLYTSLEERYPSSFRQAKVRDGEIDYRTAMANRCFLRPSELDTGHDGAGCLVTATFEQQDLHEEGYTEVLASRPRGVEVPRFLAEIGMIRAEFPLDFGSYRDLQRHRNGIVRMPLLTTVLGFNDWYLGELPDDLRAKAETLIAEQSAAIEALDADPTTGDQAFVVQNYIAMGFQVPCRVTQGLPAFVYRLELRAGKTVHPSLRRVVHEEIRQFRTLFPEVPLHVDEDPDSWTTRRGKQTITER